MLQHTFQERHKTGFVSMQGLHNLLYREEEREMKPFCAKAGIGYVGVCACPAQALGETDPQTVVPTRPRHVDPTRR